MKMKRKILDFKMIGILDSRWSGPLLNIYCIFRKATQWAKNKKIDQKFYTRSRGHKEMQYMLINSFLFVLICLCNNLQQQLMQLGEITEDPF